MQCIEFLDDVIARVFTIWKSGGFNETTLDLSMMVDGLFKLRDDLKLPSREFIENFICDCDDLPF